MGRWLPTAELRTEYLARWNARVDPALRVDGEVVRRLAAATEGFSYAYLKELFVSSMMSWVSGPEQPMDTLLGATAELLRAQMTSTALGEVREQHVPEDPEAFYRRRFR